MDILTAKPKGLDPAMLDPTRASTINTPVLAVTVNEIPRSIVLLLGAPKRPSDHF